MRSVYAGLILLATAGVGLTQVGDTLLRREEIPRAIAQLRAGDPKERAWAAEALGRRGAVRSADVQEAVTPLRELLKNDKNVNVRRAAAEALGNIGRDLDKTIPDLIRAMKSDPAEPVKIAAILALGKIGPEARAALPELRPIAQDRKKENRRLSAAARQAIKMIQARY
jgi:hypothetical protein